MSDVEACFVVVGGGIAGVSCAEQVSLLEPELSTILVSASPLVKVATNVQSVSKYLVKFDVEEQASSVLSARCPGVRVLHDTVTDLLAEERLLLMASGRRVRYDRMCVCAGARPNPVHAGHPAVLTVRDTESVRELQQRLSGARRVLVVGNGGIATELVHEVRGVEVVWAVKNDHISAAFVDPGAAEFLLPSASGEHEQQEGGVEGGGAAAAVVKRIRYTEEEARAERAEHAGGAALGPDWHERWQLRGGRSDRPLRVEYGCEIKDLLPGDEHWPAYVELTNGGAAFGVDLVVSATGVVPNVEAFTRSNSAVLRLGEDGGILVDDHMRSSLEHVYAAGDVCTAGWEHARHWFQMRLWSQARLMGAYAARCMAADRSGSVILQDFGFEMFAHVTRFFGHKVVLLGLHNGQKLGGDCELLLRAVRGQEYVKLVMQAGRVQGAVLIGESNLEETCENLILDQIDVSHLGDDLLNPLVDVEDYFD